MYKSLMNLYLEFTVQEKKRLFLLALAAIITAVIQVVGIASIFPFIAVVSNPEIIETNIYLATLKGMSGLESNNSFLVLLGLIVLFTLITTNLFLAFSTWLNVLFIEKMLNGMAYRMLQRYLQENYLFHLSRNSSELLKNLTTEVTRVIDGGVMSMITIMSNSFSVIGIIVFLVIIEPKVAFIMAFILGSSYLFIYLIFRKKLAKIGVYSLQLFSERYQCISESLGGIKDLMVFGRQKHFLEQFDDVSKRIIKCQVFKRTITGVPRYFLEIIAFGGILSVTIFLVAVENDSEAVLPLIALYGLAGYRLMPALQGIFQASATLKHDIAAVDLFYNDLQGHIEGVSGEKIKEKLPIKNSVELSDVSFTYPKSSQRAVNQLSLSIKGKTSVGIIGSSGSGKSTVVDILLGLLQPESGEITIDGISLTRDKLRSFQNNVGYVPQVIFLTDASISENIAFGIAKKNIDMQAVERAAKMANLHEFILDDLELGYDTVVGERGVRLSGGQRQRIGIARALYHDPEILVLDEATSALDTPTERNVMEAIYSLAHKKTIIMIAHRISTVKSCDNLVWLENGNIRAQGTFDQLLLAEPDFKRFTQTGM